MTDSCSLFQCHLPLLPVVLRAATLGSSDLPFQSNFVSFLFFSLRFSVCASSSISSDPQLQLHPLPLPWEILHFVPLFFVFLPFSFSFFFFTSFLCRSFSFPSSHLLLFHPLCLHVQLSHYNSLHSIYPIYLFHLSFSLSLFPALTSICSQFASSSFLFYFIFSIFFPFYLFFLCLGATATGRQSAVSFPFSVCLMQQQQQHYSLYSGNFPMSVPAKMAADGDYQKNFFF